MHVKLKKKKKFLSEFDGGVLKISLSVGNSTAFNGFQLGFPNWWEGADVHQVINTSKYFQSWRFHLWLWLFRAEQTTPQ